MNRFITLLTICATIAGAEQAAAQAALEEITVTAQRRAESAQDASVAIDLLNGEALVTRGITDSARLANLVPALMVTNGGGISSAIFMRGVGNRAQNSFIDPAITFNYDGVPMARAAASSSGQYFDLERVEVLKGPQGTLYGRNATGGVINLIPVKPRIGETSGYVSAGAGNFSELQLEGAVNFGIGESAAARLSAQSLERDALNRDGTDDVDRLSLRGQLLFDLSDESDLRIAADYTDLGGVGNGTTPIGRYLPGGLANYRYAPSGISPDEGTNTDVGNAYRNATLAAPGFGFLNAVQDSWYTDAEVLGVNAELNIGSGIGTWTIIPAYRETNQDSQFNGPGFNSGWWDSDVEQTSLEVRLANPSGESLIDYVLGAYYFDERQEDNNTFNQEFVLPLQDYTMDAESYAVFGELTWNLSDRTRLITGVRYTDDQKDMNGQINNFITFCGGLPPNLITPPGSFAQGCADPGGLPHFPTLDTPEEARTFLIDNGWASTFIPIPPGFLIPLEFGVGQILNSIEAHQVSYSESKPTYRVGLEWDVGEDSMVYASFETGYRSGGPMPNFADPYLPEFIDAYTIGSKNRFAGGTVQLNIELFHWKYEDQQINYFTLTDTGVLVSLTDNVGRSTNQGADLSLQWLATDNTLISAQVQYLDATYDDLHFITAPPRDNVNCPYEIGTSGSGGVLLDFNCSGSESIYAPDWTINIGLQHAFLLGNNELTVSVFSKYVDDQVTGFNNLPHEVIESYTMTDVDLTLRSAADTWSVSVFARNLEDERRITSTQVPLLGMAMAQHGPPLTYGARFNYNF